MRSASEVKAPIREFYYFDIERKTLSLTMAILGISLALQRFGFPFGGKAVSIVGPIGFALVIYGLASGTLCFHRQRLIIYLALILLTLMGGLWHMTSPVNLGNESIESLIQFLMLTGFAVFTFTEAIDELKFFKVFTFLFLLVAVAGIIQFFAQFIGLRLFAFSGLFPETMLYELGYNLVIPVGVGDLLKANGFVLLEPSVYSQLMALALIIEALAFRRLGFLIAFTTGLLLSFSGTGWIVLGAFVLGSVIGMGGRGLLIASGVTVILTAVIGAAAVLAPDFVEALSNRFSEINQPGTSGHLRFVTPFWMLQDVANLDPSYLLLGIGSGLSEHLQLPYEYATNTPIKVMVEFGVPAFMAYVLLFIFGHKTSLQTALVFPAMVLFLLAGSYQQLPSIIFIVLLLISVARLRVHDGSGTAQKETIKPSTAGQIARVRR